MAAREGVIDGRRDLAQDPDLTGSGFSLPLVDSASLDALNRALKDLESTNAATRQAALKTLVELGSPSLSAILRGTYDDDRKMRKDAYQTLLEVLKVSKKAKIEARKKGSLWR